MLVTHLTNRDVPVCSKRETQSPRTLRTRLPLWYAVSGEAGRRVLIHANIERRDDRIVVDATQRIFAVELLCLLRVLKRSFGL